LLGRSGDVDRSYMLHLAVIELGWDYNNQERIFNLEAKVLKLISKGKTIKVVKKIKEK
tara:strand:+ start:189 stop:362 length:174 start_codon:yes stop_codon:yes gene_type:complete